MKYHYTSKEILERIESHEAKRFYKAKEVNYVGYLKDDKRRSIQDFLSMYILKKIDNGMFKIAQQPRDNTYLVVRNNPNYKRSTNQKEKIYAKDLFYDQVHIKGLGRAIDYEVPLNNKQASGNGKIDLVFLDENTINLVEFKRPGNAESLLRAVLEIHTYFEQLDHEKYLRELSGSLNREFKQENIKKNVLIFENTKAFEVLNELQSNPNQHNESLRQLIKLLKVNIIVLSKQPVVKVPVDRLVYERVNEHE